MDHDCEAAWAAIISNADFIDGVVRKMCNRGALVDPDDFRGDLLEDVVKSWWQTHTSPKTMTARPEPVHPRTFIFMRARKIRTYRNREIERARKHMARASVDTCTGTLQTMDADVSLPLPPSKESGRAVNQVLVTQILEMAVDLASPRECLALRTVIDGCDRTDIEALGFTMRERNNMVRSVRSRLAAAAS